MDSCFYLKTMQVVVVQQQGMNHFKKQRNRIECAEYFVKHNSKKSLKMILGTNEVFIIISEVVSDK